jgi:hypothetical protein
MPQTLQPPQEQQEQQEQQPQQSPQAPQAPQTPQEQQPQQPPDEARYTLDELIAAVEGQAGIPLSALLPSRCDHPFCGFHGSFLVNGDALTPLSHADDSYVDDSHTDDLQKGEAEEHGDEAVLSADSRMTTAQQNREYIGRRWTREPDPDEERERGSEQECCYEDDEDDECCCEEDETCSEKDATCGESETCCGEVECSEGEDKSSCEGAECCCEDDEDDECCCEADESDECCCEDDLETFEGFLNGVRKHGFTLTAMAFQDAMNLDVERLRRCSLHVYHEGVLKPFCARYVTAMD